MYIKILTYLSKTCLLRNMLLCLCLSIVSYSLTDQKKKKKKLNFSLLFPTGIWLKFSDRFGVCFFGVARWWCRVWDQTVSIRWLLSDNIPIVNLLDKTRKSYVVMTKYQDRSYNTISLYLSLSRNSWFFCVNMKILTFEFFV